MDCDFCNTFVGPCAKVNMSDYDEPIIDLNLGELLNQLRRKPTYATSKNQNEEEDDEDDEKENQRERLHVAASDGNVSLVKSLLEKGEDPALPNKIGWTALHCAVISGDVQTVKLLLGWEDKKLLNLKTRALSSPLHIAAVHANRELCKLLIDCGVDATSVNKHGENAMHVALSAGNVDVALYLAENQLIDFKQKSISNMNLLHYAVGSNHLGLLECLVENGTSVNCKSVTDHTPLLIAAAIGSLDVFKFFIEKGADLKVENDIGCDALDIASKNGNLEVVKYLIDTCNFDVNRVNKKRFTPLLLATYSNEIKVMEYLLDAGAEINNACGIKNFTPCLMAAIASNVDTLRFLVERGANLDVVDDMLSDPFQLACDSDDFEKIKYLVELGKFDLTKRNTNGKTAWIKSSRHSSLEVKKFLVELGANIHDTDNFNLGGMVLAAQFSTPENCQFMLDIGLGFDVLTKDGGNALHQSCVSGNIPTAKFILGLKRLDVNATLNLGLTALLIAAGRGHVDMVKLLLENGADINKRSERGHLAIHAAAKTGNRKTIHFLLSLDENGSLLEDRTNWGETPLLLSCLNMNIMVLRDGKTSKRHRFHCSDIKYTAFHCLLNAGADLHAVDYTGKNAFLTSCLSRDDTIFKYLVEGKGHKCDMSSTTKYGENAVHLAAKSGNKSILKSLIEELKMDVNHRANDGKTPLMVAAEFGSQSTCRYLLEQGANAQAMMKNGENALFCACTNKDFRLANAKILFETGKIPVNKQNKFGQTVLHLAVHQRSLDLVKYFVEVANADTELEDDNGWTVLHVAAKFAPLDINKYLVNAKQSLLNRQNHRYQLPKDLARQNEDVSVLLFYDEIQPGRSGAQGRQNARDNFMAPRRSQQYNHSLFSTNWRS